MRHKTIAGQFVAILRQSVVGIGTALGSVDREAQHKALFLQGLEFVHRNVIRAGGSPRRCEVGLQQPHSSVLVTRLSPECVFRFFYDVRENVVGVDEGDCVGFCLVRHNGFNFGRFRFRRLLRRGGRGVRGPPWPGAVAA